MASRTFEVLEQMREEVLQEICSLTEKRTDAQKSCAEESVKTAKFLEKANGVLQDQIKLRDEMRLSMEREGKLTKEGMKMVEEIEAKIEEFLVKKQTVVESITKFKQNASDLDERYKELLEMRLRQHSDILQRMMLM